jgi:peptidyl-prolyl cis-trans isomerase SurA
MIVHKYLLIVAIILLISVSSPTSYPQTVVGEFGKYKITLDEFEYAYSKIVGGWENSQDDSISEYEDFMDLYLKFRMKLRDAQVRAYPKDEEMSRELSEYKKTVGVSYIIEKGIVEPGIEQLYKRRKEELKVSHIMVRPDTIGEAATLAYTERLVDSIKAGMSYEEIAKKYSQDKFSAPSGGDIYFVTAGVLPAEFEDAMYKTNAGSFNPEVVQTQYGFHIIKVSERIKRVPKIRASHILISYFDDSGEVDSAAAKLTADSVVAKLNEGAAFEDLVEFYSDDTGTVTKGGDLGFFERRMMVREFDEVAFSMDLGEISEPVQTNFGYHIIKLIEKMEYPTFEEEREELKNMYKKQRYDADLKKVADSLRTKYNFTVNEEMVDYLIEQSDSVRFGMVHPRLDEISDKVLFTYSDKSVNIGSFIELANNTSSFTARPMDQRTEIDNAIDKVSEDLVMEEEAMNLDKINPEFASLMEDYRDGIYIFKIQEEEVWDKVKIDSADIHNYWESNKENYSWPDRVSYSEIFSTRDSLINKYYQMLNEGAAFDSIAALYTERPGKKKDAGFYKLQDVNFSDLSREANKIENVGDYTEPFPFSGGFSIFKLDDRQLAGLKTFEEAKAEVSGEYQELMSKKMEDEYIQRLEARYNPVIYYDELAKAFKTKEEN